MQQQVSGTTCRVDMTNIYATTILLMEPHLLLLIPTMIPAQLPTHYTDTYNEKHKV